MKRSMSPSIAFPCGVDADGRKLCAWCKKQLPKKSGNQRYCSNACLNEVWIRCSPNHARDQVRKRDQGICAMCSLDCGEDDLDVLSERYQRECTGSKYDDPRRISWLDKIATLKASLRRKYGGACHSWEVDHIVPVAEGGIGCGLEGLRTLCRDCHRKRTASWRRGRKKDVSQNRHCL